MKTGVKAADAMTRQPVTLAGDTNLHSCARTMENQHVGAVLVKDGDTVRGILTEQDIVRKVVAKGENPLDKKVSEVMERNLIIVAPGEDIFDALRTMRDQNIRHLPVIENDECMGLLTMKDILKIQPQLFDILLEKFEIRELERKMQADSP